MALSLVTVSPPNARALSNIDGATVEVFVDITTGTADYATGGYTLPPSTFGLSEILYLDCASLGGYVAHYNYSTQKLQLFQNAAGAGKLAEVGAGGNASPVTGRAIAIGKGFPLIGTSI